MTAKRNGVGRRPNVVVRSAQSGRFVTTDRVFSDVKVPGLGKVKVMDRDTYEKASKKAGGAIKTVIGEPTRAARGERR